MDGEIVNLIGAIYDAVLDPTLWHLALDRIRKYFAFETGVMAINRFVHEPVSVSIAVNLPDDYWRFMSPEYSDEIVKLWGGRSVVEQIPVEEPVALSSIIDERTLMANRYYTEFGVPHGLVDQAAIILTRDRRQVGNIGFGRHRDAGPIGEDVIAGLRILAPHLRRAALITGILDEERKTRTMFEAVLRAVRTAIVLVDARTRIIYANPAAEADFDAGATLRSEHGTLELRGEVVPGQLKLAIEQAARGDIPLGRRGIAIPGVRGDASPYIAHVLPLADRKVSSGVPGDAVAAVFVADRDEEPRLVIDAATMLYSLTPTEARVFELVIAGYGSAEIASALVISPNTLKWHTRQLFEKTGQHRRSDLVRLGSKLRLG